VQYPQHCPGCRDDGEQHDEGKAQEGVYEQATARTRMRGRARESELAEIMVQCAQMAALLLRESSGDFLQTWYASVGRKLVNELREVLRELRQKILLGDVGLLRNIADSLLPECRMQLPGFDRLVLTGSEPGVDDLTVPCGRQLFEEAAKAANEATIGRCGISATSLRYARIGCSAAAGQHLPHKKGAEPEH
jgi:hypothetical protein